MPVRFSIQTEELFRHNFFSEDLYFGLHSKGRVWYDDINLEKQELDFVIFGAESGFFSGNCLRYRAGCVILNKIIFNFN